MLTFPVFFDRPMRSRSSELPWPQFSFGKERSSSHSDIRHVDEHQLPLRTLGQTENDARGAADHSFSAVFGFREGLPTFSLSFRRRLSSRGSVGIWRIRQSHQRIAGLSLASVAAGAR
eukprot:scaffold3474_cov246-Pinguiococcus_pyrenoidosus.AAC.13